MGDSKSQSRIPGGPKAVLIFLVSLTAYVTQSELTQYVQATRHYRKPLLLLFLSHASFLWMLPVHLAFLRLRSDEPLRPVLRTLAQVARRQVDALPFGRPDAPDKAWPWERGSLAILLLTLGVTAPAALFYLCVPLTDMTSITTIFNTSALFAFLFAVALLGEQWAARKLIAVGLATVGVTVVAYGGSDSANAEAAGNFRLLGDALALAGAAAYGIYEVGYKKWIALNHVKTSPGSAQPPVLPFALYPNLITSLIGICTIGILLPVFPILHFAGLEEFESPWSFAASRSATEGTPLGLTLAVALCGSLGVLYNGAFMICLSLWGPVVASVGNLLTIILIAISDAVIHSSDDSAAISPVVILGGILVASSFAVLVWDMTRAGSATGDAAVDAEEAGYRPVVSDDDELADRFSSRS